MSAASSAKTAKANLIAAIETVLPDWRVSYGVPDGEADDMVIVGNMTVDEDAARLSNQRRRWFRFTIECEASAYRGGGEEAQQPATEAVLDALAAIADYLQDAGVSGSTQTSLGGAVEWARLSAFDVVEPEPDDVEQGRLVVAPFTITGSLLA